MWTHECSEIHTLTLYNAMTFTCTLSVQIFWVHYILANLLKCCLMHSATPGFFKSWTCPLGSNKSLMKVPCRLNEYLRFWALNLLSSDKVTHLIDWELGWTPACNWGYWDTNMGHTSTDDVTCSAGMMWHWVDK